MTSYMVGSDQLKANNMQNKLIHNWELPTKCHKFVGTSSPMMVIKNLQNILKICYDDFHM